MLKCTRCGKHILLGARHHLININDDNNDMEIVCDRCYKYNIDQVGPVHAAIKFSVAHPQLASIDELLDCLVHENIGIADRVVIVDELRVRLRDK